MTTKELANIIYNTNGEPFTCLFVKRSTGEERTLKGQLGVQKDLKGVGLAYEPKEQKLITVFDIEKDGYRMVPIEGLLMVEFKGIKYYIDDQI